MKKGPEGPCCACRWSSRLELDHVRTNAQFVQVVRPPLHHFPPRWQVCRAVVGPPIGILHRVGQLVLYQLQDQDLALVDALAMEPGAITVTAQGLTVALVQKAGPGSKR